MLLVEGVVEQQTAGGSVFFGFIVALIVTLGVHGIAASLALARDRLSGLRSADGGASAADCPEAHRLDIACPLSCS